MSSLKNNQGHFLYSIILNFNLIETCVENTQELFEYTSQNGA